MCATKDIWVMAESKTAYSPRCRSVAEAKRTMGREKIIGWHIDRENAIGLLWAHGEPTATTMQEAEAAVARLSAIKNPLITLDRSHGNGGHLCVWRGHRAYRVILRDGCEIIGGCKVHEDDILGIGEVVCEYREVNRDMIPPGHVLMMNGYTYTSSHDD